MFFNDYMIKGYKLKIISILKYVCKVITNKWKAITHENMSYQKWMNTRLRLKDLDT